MKIFGREPAAILAGIQAIIALLIGFGALAPIGLAGAGDAVIVSAVLSAAFAVYLAFATNETLLAPVVELFKAGTALAAVYGLNLTAEQSALAITAIQGVITAWHRGNVVPLVGKKTLKRVDPYEAVAENDAVEYADSPA